MITRVSAVMIGVPDLVAPGSGRAGVDVLRDVDGLCRWQGCRCWWAAYRVKCRRWSPGLVTAVEDLVVRCALVEVRERRLGLCGYVRRLVVVSHEGLDRVQAVEPHQGHELHVALALAADQVDGAEPGNPPRLDIGDDLLTHDALVGVSVLVGGPASPQAADHERQCSNKPSSRQRAPASSMSTLPGCGPGSGRVRSGQAEHL